MKSTLSKITIMSSMALAVLFTSCGKKDTAVSLTEELTTQLVSFAETSASVKDKASAEAAAKKIDEIADEITSIGTRMESLEGEPSAEELQEIQDKMVAAEESMAEIMSKVSGDVRSDLEVQKIMGDAIKSFFEKTKDAQKIFEKYEKKK